MAGRLTLLTGYDLGSAVSYRARTSFLVGPRAGRGGGARCRGRAARGGFRRCAACGRGEVAPSNGTFTIQFSTVKDNTQINGIEILS